MRIHINLSINKVVETLILSDFLLFFAFGLLAPIFAIFVTQKIEGGTLGVIGIATTMYWLFRSVTTVPLSRFMDKTDGERDEFYFMFLGSIILSIVPFLFIASNKPWHIYVLQSINGLAHSMAVPGWRIIFTNHLDKGKTGYEWSIEDVAVGIGIAASATVGAWIAESFGFNALFVIIGIMGLVGSFVLLPVYKSTHTLKEMRRYHKDKFQPIPKVDALK